MTSKTVEQTSAAEVVFETPKLPDKYADESYKLFSQVKVEPPTAEEAERIRKKSVRWILSFLCVGYHLMYVDKQTVRIMVSYVGMQVYESNITCLPISSEVRLSWEFLRMRI